jgi:hypothetical protein
MDSTAEEWRGKQQHSHHHRERREQKDFDAYEDQSRYSSSLVFAGFGLLENPIWMRF